MGERSARGSADTFQSVSFKYQTFWLGKQSLSLSTNDGNDDDDDDKSDSSSIDDSGINLGVTW